MKALKLKTKQIILGVLILGTIVPYSCGRRKSKSTSTVEAFSSDPDLAGMGAKAYDVDQTLLADVYAVTSTIAPAAVRPDPDMYARRLLRQFRAEDLVVARAIGDTEDYRPLLGGASEDFKTPPQETYDATSLLALQKVAEEICSALVAPTPTRHPGWKTVLPYPLAQIDDNLKYLAQRLLGISNSKISDSMITLLHTALTDAVGNGTVSQSSYTLPCTMLALDAEALLL